MITIENVTNTMAHRTVLRDVSFTVHDGSITGFVGPYGAGKTTTMRTALGLTPPDNGRVQFEGHNYRDIAPASPSRQPARGEVETVKLHGFSVAQDPTASRWNTACSAGMPKTRNIMASEDHGLRTVELAATRYGEDIASSRRRRRITP